MHGSCRQAGYSAVGSDQGPQLAIACLRLTERLTRLHRTSTSEGAKPETVEGYLEWFRDDHIIVEGQRVYWNRATRLQLGQSRTVASIPLGSEMTIKGHAKPRWRFDRASECHCRPDSHLRAARQRHLGTWEFLALNESLCEASLVRRDTEPAEGQEPTSSP